MTKQTINTPCSTYEAMRSSWQLIDDLLGGTAAMRAAGTRWLPREQAETRSNYQARLGRSFLYGGYANALKRIVSKPFSKPVIVSGELPEAIAALGENCDRAGQNITQFARGLYESAINYGLTHVLVDFPAAGQGLSLAEERELGLRPFFVHVEPKSLISWQTTRSVSGQAELAEIRIRESHLADDGNYGQREVHRVRVIRPDQWQLWQFDDQNDEFVIVGEGVNSLGKIPLVTVYTNRQAFMQARPPLQNLAWLNIEHWQSSSDQRNILRYARAGFLFGRGLTSEDCENGLTLGPNQAMLTTSENAEISWVEHSGSAIESGRQDLLDIQDRMEIEGTQPLVRRSGSATATGQAIGAAGVDNDAQAWVRALENGLKQAYLLAAEWIGSKPTGDFSVDIFSDFGINLNAADNLELLAEMRNSGNLSLGTYLREVKRYGLLAEEISIADEIDSINNVAAADDDAGDDSSGDDASAGKSKPSRAKDDWPGRNK